MEEPDAFPAPTDGNNGGEAMAPEPITLETALAWLAASRPASVLALLREPEFAFISMKVFVGFRVTPTSYANPLVRRRLAQELLQNDTFSDKVKALAEEASHAPTSGGAGPKEADGSSSVTSPELGAGGKPSREETLKAERNQRRRERDEARAALRQAEEGRARAETERAQIEAARAEQARQVQQQQQRIARMERQVARMQAEQKSLLKALSQDKVSSPPRPSSHSSIPKTQIRREGDAETPWREAIRHLLHKAKYDLALQIALDVLRTHPEDIDALDIAATAYERKGLLREAVELLRRKVSIHLTHGEAAWASETLMRLLMLTPTLSDAARDVRQWLPHLRTSEAIAAGRAAAERLRGQSPERYAWLTAEVKAAAPALSDQLMPPPGALGPDDALPLSLPLPGAWTARRLVEAVNANAVPIVEAARQALARMDAQSAPRAWDALARAVDTTDDSALAPLRRAPRGAAIVDGSNAAWFDQHFYANPRPRLRPILDLRRALRLRGYFPVLLYADAPLPYTVDDRTALRVLLDRSEISLVDSGVDADEVLLREAKRHGAVLVTNDYMADWDPQNEVTKLQYTISLTGEAHLLA